MTTFAYADRAVMEVIKHKLEGTLPIWLRWQIVYDLICCLSSVQLSAFVTGDTKRSVFCQVKFVYNYDIYDSPGF